MSAEIKQISNQTELAATCRLVARFWLKEVDQATLELLKNTQVRQAWTELGGIVPDDGGKSSELLDALAADYCQVLIGPKKHLPPVQSVWSDHVFQSNAATSTKHFYELYADYRPPGTIDDHLGCQLHFVGFLLDQASDDQTATQVLAKFQQSHLVWALPLIDRVAQKAETDFYRGLADVTRRLIKELAGENLTEE